MSSTIDSKPSTSPLVLVVDDTEATRYAVVRVLKSGGFRTAEAETGLGGLRLANDLLPDLVILDIHLPDLLGFEVCRRLKNAPLTATIPVLQISASFVTAEDRVNGLEGGADSYLTHPVEPPVLIATARALLRLRDLNRTLASSDERLQVALRASPVELFELDHELRYRWRHVPRDSRLPKNIVDRRIDEVFPGSEAAAVLEVQRQVLSSRQAGRTTYRLMIDGIERFYDATYDPIFHPDGSVAGIVGAAVDVTEREVAKTEIESARDAAEAANRAKSQFIANISHEIRTPLGVILGFSDLILDGSQSPGENLKSVAVIKRNAGQLSKLIDEVLDLSKIEADRMEIEAIRFDLVDVVDDVISLLSLQAGEKGIALSADYEGPIPDMFKSDPSRLRQILINLLGNALKFTEKGIVRLTVSSLSQPRSGEPLFIRFQVRDSGIGISNEHSQKLFTAFSQGDASMNRRFGGTGLGLMLSKRLALALGGTLELTQSEIGKGSTFTLTIIDPAFTGEFKNVSRNENTELNRKTHPENASVARVLEGISILLVEDSPDNQVMVQRFLSQVGAAVEIASDGEAGVAVAKAGAHQVVLMDIQMPVMDGYHATLKLRADGFTKPIVALTAHALKGEREKCLAAGFSDYLTKPLNRQSLIAKIQELCGSRN